MATSRKLLGGFRRFTIAIAIALAAFVLVGCFVVSDIVLFPRSPRIEYPTELNLGDRQLGELATADFTIANRGRAILVLDAIRSSCSCAGLERWDGSAYVGLESLRLQAGEAARVRVRVAVRGRSGDEVLNTVHFRTNDPTCPIGEIRALITRICGGAVATPRSVVFGAILVGTQPKITVLLTDTASPARSLDRVISSSPELVEVRTTRGDPSGASAITAHDSTIAKLEVSINTQRAGDIAGEVQVFLSGGPVTPDIIKDTAHVVPPVECQPATIVLPRQTGAGAVYEAECLIRSNNGAPLIVDARSVPAGCSVEFKDSGDNTERLLRVVCEHRAVSHLPSRMQLRIGARAGSYEGILDLPILVAR